MVNEWTRDDLPSVGDILDAFVHWNADPGPVTGHALDAVVEHLNANGGAPVPVGRAANNMLRETLANVERDRDRLRRAHGIVEGERDQAREQWKKWEHKANEAEREVSTWRTSTESAHGDFLQAAHDRDEAVARAEAAEARTAPAVTKAEIEKAIDETGVLSRRRSAEFVADAVWSLVSGADPAVFVVRESDLPEVENKGDGGWDSGGQWYPSYATTEIIRENIARSARNLVNDLAVARAIEAGQAVDPLLDKAQEFAALADWELTDREAGLLHTVARHVLGQEASDGR